MPNWRMFLVFSAAVLIIMGGVHTYLFDRLVLATGVPAPLSSVIGILLLAMVVGIPASLVGSRWLSRQVARLLVVPIYLWLGFVFLLFFVVLAFDVGRLLASVALRVSNAAPLLGSPDPSLLPWRTAAAAATGITAVSAAFGTWWGLTRLEVRRLEIPLSKLPRELDGFTILQLTDLHLDLVRGGRWLQSVVERASALNPDLIAITGDLVEGSVAQFADEVEPLRSLDAPHGVFFVTGNHEYFHDLHGWLRLLDEWGVRVLRNERVAIGNGDAWFDLAGVDDPDGRRLAPGHGTDLKKALAGRDPRRAVVLLAHQPLVIREAVRFGVDLVLSGHTHGGQIWPFGYLVHLQQPYRRGLVKVNGTRLYVSQGTGFWGPPMRLGTTAEMTLIVLTSHSRSPGDQNEEGVPSRE